MEETECVRVCVSAGVRGDVMNRSWNWRWQLQRQSCHRDRGGERRERKRLGGVSRGPHEEMSTPTLSSRGDWILVCVCVCTCRHMDRLSQRGYLHLFCQPDFQKSASYLQRTSRPKIKRLCVAAVLTCLTCVFFRTADEELTRAKRINTLSHKNKHLIMHWEEFCSGSTEAWCSV